MSSFSQDMKRMFSGATLDRALRSFDKATALIVATVWTSAAVIIILATFAVFGAVKSKQEMTKLLVDEPAQLKIEFSPASSKDLQPLLDRIKKRYPDLKLELAKDGSMTIFSENPEHFRQWIFALNYIDSISPQFRWSIRTLCVGTQCSMKMIMHAALRAEKVNFVVPDSE